MSGQVRWVMMHTHCKSRKALHLHWLFMGVKSFFMKNVDIWVLKSWHDCCYKDGVNRNNVDETIKTKR